MGSAYSVKEAQTGFEDHYVIKALGKLELVQKLFISLLVLRG